MMRARSSPLPFMGEVAPSIARGRRGQVCDPPLALSDASLRSRHLSHEWERRRCAAAFILTLLLLIPTAASAHIVHGEAIGFVSGFRHPISGWDHVIAMVAVGLWGAQLGRPGIWVLPVTFPLVMAFGGFLGLVGLHLPFSEVAIALSGVCLGAAVAMEWRPPLPVAGALVGLFGLFHGYAHGAELPPGQNALLYSLGFVLATGLLHATGIAIGLIHRWPYGRLALRGAGAAILCGGGFFLWSALT
jgi:urease accessory protein